MEITGSFKRIIYIAVAFFAFLLIVISFTSGFSFKSFARAGSMNPDIGCSVPLSVSQHVLPLGLYGLNLVYANLNFSNGYSQYGLETSFYVWNIGADYKPNTADDLNPVSFKDNGAVLLDIPQSDYGDLSPKISDRYVVWTSDNRTAYEIKVVDMGLDGILSQQEALNSRVIYAIHYRIPQNYIRPNSISLKGSKVSFTYYDSVGQTPPEVGFCDLSLNSGNGSCYPNNVILFSPDSHLAWIRFANSYFYYYGLGRQQVLFSKREYLDQQQQPGSPAVYSTYSWSQNLGLNLISDQIELIDLYEGLAVVYYQGGIYGYFYPGGIPGSLIPISTGIVKNAQVNVRNTASPLGNYLVAYTKSTNGIDRLYLGSLGNRREIQTPFLFANKPLLDSSSAGNYLYVYHFSGSSYNLYYSQCFGI